MKKFSFAPAAACLLGAGLMISGVLSGCSRQPAENGEPQVYMTQPIATGESAEPPTGNTADDPAGDSSGVPAKDAVAGIAAAAAAISPAESAPAASTDTLRQYSRIKAELDAVDIEIELLEAEYRIGKLDLDSFTAKKSELKKQEDSLELKRAEMKIKLRTETDVQPPLEGTADELLAQLSEAEMLEDSLERQEDSLELEYRSGTITREDYVVRQTEILIQDEKNDDEKDRLEHALELMGIDD